MSQKETIDIGTVDNATELVFSAGRDDRFYVLQPKSAASEYGYAESYVDFISRFPKHQVKRTCEHYIDDTDGQWFAFYDVDCFDPPFAVIRARSFETAYEVFCDEFSDWLKVDDSDADDYPEDERTYSGSGVHIDTDNVNGHELTLVRVECAR